MIDAARDVLRGLVASRLWPIAVALLVALVAVPVILRGGGGADGGDLPIAAPPADTSTAAAPGATPATRTRKDAGSGQGRNPFRSEGGGTPPAADGETAPPAGDTPATADTGGAESASGSTPKTAPNAPKAADDAAAPKPAAGPAQTVSLRFGTPGKRTIRRSLKRRASLPSGDNPLVVLGGILRDGRTMRFRISPAAAATGDGVCRPSPTRCRTIDLRPGDTQFFDFPDEPLYRLDLLSVAGRTAPVPALSASRTARAVFAASVRFGGRRAKPSDSLNVRESLGRLGAVAFEYLGVSADRRSGVFLLGPRARLKSHNACLDGVACRVISLRPQDTATVSVNTRKGWLRYGMRLVRLRPRVSSTLVRATRSRARTSAAGRPLLQELMRDPKTAAAVRALRLSARHGTVTRRIPASRP